MAERMIVNHYTPRTPRTIAIWAVILAYGHLGRKATIEAIIEAGIHDSSTNNWWRGPIDQQSAAHVRWLERQCLVQWVEEKAA